MSRFSKSERIAIFTAITLIISGVAAATLSKINCREERKSKNSLSLKICTPEERAKVDATLQKGRQATGSEVESVIGELDEILDKKLDCGWESVMALKGRLNSRRQP